MTRFTLLIFAIAASGLGCLHLTDEEHAPGASPPAEYLYDDLLAEDTHTGTVLVQSPAPEPAPEQDGDGPSDSDEDCDGDEDGCDGPCCGNGQVDAGEDCDDGNTTGGDGCSATCKVEIIP